MSVVGNISRSFAVVADVGGSRRKDDTPVFALTTDIYNLGVGGRLSVRSQRAVVFAQVVGGIIQINSRVVADGLDVSGTRRRQMFQPGAGVVVLLGKRFGITGEVAYRHIFLREAEDGARAADDVRVLVGMRIAF